MDWIQLCLIVASLLMFTQVLLLLFPPWPAKCRRRGAAQLEGKRPTKQWGFQLGIQAWGDTSNPPHLTTFLLGLAFSVKANSLHSPSSKVKDTCCVVMSCVKAILQGTLAPYIRILRRAISIGGPEQMYLYWESKLVCAETIRASDQVLDGLGIEIEASCAALLLT